VCGRAQLSAASRRTGSDFTIRIAGKRQEIGEPTVLTLTTTEHADVIGAEAGDAEPGEALRFVPKVDSPGDHARIQLSRRAHEVVVDKTVVWPDVARLHATTGVFHGGHG